MTVAASPHVAVLVCDTPITGITDKYGDFGDNVRDLLLVQASFASQWPLVKYQVAFEGDSSEYIPGLNASLLSLMTGIANGSIKGAVFTGSRADSFDDSVPWIVELNKFIAALYKLDGFPIVGICFGHQILARNLGCKVARSLPEVGWESGSSTITLNKDIITLENSPFKDILVTDGAIHDHLNLVEFHRDIVYNVPVAENARNTEIHSIGYTAKCAIQGLVAVSGPIRLLTFQGHPEFSSEMALDMLAQDVEKGILSRDLYEKCAYNTKMLNNQGPLIGLVINRFLAPN